MATTEAYCKYLKKDFWNQPENWFWLKGMYTKKGIEYIEKSLNVRK